MKTAQLWTLRPTFSAQPKARLMPSSLASARNREITAPCMVTATSRMRAAGASPAMISLVT